MFHQWNPPPYTFPPFPQPVYPPAVAVAADPPLHPPGTDPYSNSPFVPSTYVGLEGQPQFYADPVAASYNWVVPQADTVGFALKSTFENQVASTTSNSLLNGNLAIQSLGHNASSGKHVKTKFIQPVRCEVCKIDCNSKDVFDEHVLGKKHKKNLETLNSSLVGTTFGNINVLNRIGDASGQLVQGTPDVSAASKNLIDKKRKLVVSGVKSNSARVCSVCNVVCNSQEVFDKHLSGKRHKALAFLASQNPFVAAIRSQYDDSLKKQPKKNKVVQYAWCEVCKISCNSNEIYTKHLTGKKHLKNMEKVEKGKSNAGTSNVLPSATYSIIGQMENPAASNPSSDDVQKTQTSLAEAPEDLETKKRKIVESGTAVNSIRTCTICNVVCNSQTVFDFHLAGQKHVAMMKKQAVSGMSMLVPTLVTALPN